MRVFFTGGSGKAGRHAIRHLVERGHRVVNGDMVPLGDPTVADLRIDLTVAGQVFNALSAYGGLDELEPGTGVPRYDAVVHFAAIPAILVRPDNETFRINALSTYNIIDAAVKLGIRKVIFASSETTYGICFAEGEVRPEYVPIDEEHPTVPHDSYAMSKVVNEVTARSFQARSGIDIYGLRINNVIEPHEYAPIAAKRSYLAGQRSTVKKFVKAFSDATRYLIDNREGTMRPLTKLLNSNDADVVDFAYQYLQSNSDATLYPPDEAVKNLIRMSAYMDKKLGSISANRVLDLSILDELGTKRNQRAQR